LHYGLVFGHFLDFKTPTYYFTGKLKIHLI